MLFVPSKEDDIAITITTYEPGEIEAKKLTSHFSIELICKGFPTHHHGKIKKSVNKLRRKGYLYTKPHPSGNSYGLTDEGRRVAKELEEEYQI
ncbi:MAG: hypothetical protein R6U44_02690 [Archaeoglobaceae archaeon]